MSLRPIFESMYGSHQKSNTTNGRSSTNLNVQNANVAQEQIQNLTIENPNPNPNLNAVTPNSFFDYESAEKSLFNRVQIIIDFGSELINNIINFATSFFKTPATISNEKFEIFNLSCAWNYGNTLLGEEGLNALYKGHIVKKLVTESENEVEKTRYVYKDLDGTLWELPEENVVPCELPGENGVMRTAYFIIE